MSGITLGRGGDVPSVGISATVLDDLTADLFDLGLRAVPVTDMAGSNTTSDCTDNGCSGTCPSVGCSTDCDNKT